jgi:hypothetical protein
LPVLGLTLSLLCWAIPRSHHCCFCRLDFHCCLACRSTVSRRASAPPWRRRRRLEKRGSSKPPRHPDDVVQDRA